MLKNKASDKTGSDAKGRRALGRGLDALFPDLQSIDETSSDYLVCDIARIKPNRYQPRIEFNPEELAELAQSIRDQGVITPLIVRRDGRDFELIAGERRLRAAKQAGLGKIPVVVKTASDAQMLEMALIENIQRKNLNPLEEAEGYNRLMEEFQLTQEQVAERMGKSRPAIANQVRLLKLPEQIKDGIRDGSLSMGHARAILGTESSAQQLAAFRQVVQKGLSVRQTESLMNRLKKSKPKPSAKPAEASDIYIREICEDLARHFGTRVRINRSKGKGRIEIDFFSDDDLDRLINLLKGH